MKIQKRKRTGFTLIEIMLVVTIIALLLGAAVARFSPVLDWVKAVRVQSDIKSLKTALLTYQSTNGFYPTTEQGLQALVSKPQVEPIPERWFRFMDSIQKDPWGSPYVYRCPGIKFPDTFDLYSAGPNRVDDNGAGDDDWGQ